MGVARRQPLSVGGECGTGNPPGMASQRRQFPLVSGGFGFLSLRLLWKPGERLQPKSGDQRDPDEPRVFTQRRIFRGTFQRRAKALVPARTPGSGGSGKRLRGKGMEPEPFTAIFIPWPLIL